MESFKPAEEAVDLWGRRPWLYERRKQINRANALSVHTADPPVLYSAGNGQER